MPRTITFLAGIMLAVSACSSGTNPTTPLLVETTSTSTTSTTVDPNVSSTSTTAAETAATTTTTAGSGVVELEVLVREGQVAELAVTVNDDVHIGLGKHAQVDLAAKG